MKTNSQIQKYLTLDETALLKHMKDNIVYKEYNLCAIIKRNKYIKYKKAVVIIILSNN